MNHDVTLDQTQASHLAGLAMKCIQREYPNKLDHTINDLAGVQNPRALHPAFYGCFDWHSSVHGHWMLARLLRTFPSMPEAKGIRVALSENLSEKNLLAEANYLKSPNTESFERTYGWAWLLKLTDELYAWDDADAKVWSKNLKPLTEALVARYLAFFPKQRYPIRTGVHPNTAFGLAFALDFAVTTENRQLMDLVRERSMAYFGDDQAYPAAWEPGGEDFFSPALVEADLMRRLMKPDEFAAWFRRFLPDLSKAKSLLEPTIVSDRADPKLSHLDGLNLSRAWCMRNIARALPADDPARRSLTDSARRHAATGLEHVASGEYAGEHWLASFAVLMLSTPAPELQAL